MTERELLNALKGEISLEEAEALQRAGELPLNEFNRETLLEMLAMEVPGTGTVPTEEVAELAALLDGFLGRYLADRPEAWKWIRLSCTYLSFLVRRPLHPQQTVGYTITQEDGQTVYHCPAREEGPESTCRFCVCRKLNTAGSADEFRG